MHSDLVVHIKSIVSNLFVAVNIDAKLKVTLLKKLNIFQRFGVKSELLSSVGRVKTLTKASLKQICYEKGKNNLINKT